MLSYRPCFRLRAKVKQQAWRDTFVAVKVFITHKLAVIDSLLYSVVIRKHIGLSILMVLNDEVGPFFI
jgi:hypothetical protein